MSALTLPVRGIGASQPEVKMSESRELHECNVRLHSTQSSYAHNTQQATPAKGDYVYVVVRVGAVKRLSAARRRNGTERGA